MITVYSKPNCPYCVQAKKLLERWDIEFTMVDVTEDAKSMEFIKSRGHRSVPQLYIDDMILVEGGFQGLEKMTKQQIMEKI